MQDFVHLHLHTQYSLLDGAIRFDRLFTLANKFGMRSCAITDHGNMFGVVDFHFTAKDYGIKPIIGCEAYIAPKSRLDRKPRGEETAYHVVLLAMNEQGYKNLIKIVSFANLEGFYYVPRSDKELLRQYNEGIICLTACLKGEIPSLILKGDKAHLRETVEEYRSIFGDRLYFELQDNGLEEQKKVNEGLVDLSRHYGIPLVATNDCHYLRREEAIAHELLMCIQTGKTMSDKDRLSFKTEEFYFKSIEEMSRAFSSYPEALSNTAAIAEMCNLDIDTGTYHFPDFKPPGHMGTDEYFEDLCGKGFQKRMAHAGIDDLTIPGAETLKKYSERLRYERDVIEKTGFTSYFLIVADFINYAKDRGIPVGPGRGSAAGSLVAFCLGITDIDPIKYDLLFERFLNPERISMPDIDVDFCMDGRDEVIRYVTEKYGKDNVAQIITFGTMQSKAAVRDVGRALGMAYGEVDRIAKLITTQPNMTIERAIREEPQLKDLYQRDPKVKELLDNAMVLEGLARHASTHAAGIVISNKHLAEHLPLYRGKKGETLTQYPMKVIEKIGLVKIDFLGLQTLTVIDNVIGLLRAQGIDLDITNIPLDNRKAYELLSSGDTSGIFQLESEGMRDLLTRLKPVKFDDIMPLIALYRPGPLKSGMVDMFIKRKDNPAAVSYEAPQLEDVLSDTYGVIIYQEQIMKIATVLSNFSIKDADALRKAMSKKIPEQIEAYKEKFIAGALSNSVKREVAERIYEVILRFGEYGFNKSHSTAYALVAYQTAFLKANHRVPFMAAILTSEVNNTDKMVRYVTECRERGIVILPPDINRSKRQFTVVGDSIRYGLAGIKNVGAAAIENILGLCDRVGEFTSFIQFLDEIDTQKVNKKVIESLIKAGCFDEFGLKRSQLFHLLNEKGEKVRKKENANHHQMDIFGGTTETIEAPSVPEMDELPYDEILKGEKEALGFYFSEHPLKSFQDIIGRITRHDTQNIRTGEIKEDVDIAGIVSTSKEVVTKKGDRMAYIMLEDTQGSVEVIVFPDLYAQSHLLLKSDQPVVVTGSVERSEDGTAKMKAKRVRPLDEVARDIRRTVKITVYCDRFKKEDLKKLRDVLLGVKGKSRLLLEFVFNGDRQTLAVAGITVDHGRLDILRKYFENCVDYEVFDEVLP
jgi:DNA polymerase III subunit alpha